MIPLLIGNIASDALSALGSLSNTTGSTSSTPGTSQSDLFDQLIAKLQAGGTEKTTVQADGSSITTAATSNGQQVVSETSASGQSLTQAGHVSPVLLNNFLNSLFSTLQVDGATLGNGTASSVGQAANALTSQLTGGSTGTQGLVSSFSSLLQNSGIALPSGATASTALKSFVANAVPKIESGVVTRTGINVSA